MDFLLFTNTYHDLLPRALRIKNSRSADLTRDKDGVVIVTHPLSANKNSAYKMIKLTPEKIEFTIDTTFLTAAYNEAGDVRLEIEAQRLHDHKNGTHSITTLAFENVAELRCITLNFYKSNHLKYQIPGIKDDELEYWEKTGTHPDPKFYQVTNSDWLMEKRAIYDPANFLELKHYLVAGYDSYVELLASRYRYSFST